MAVCLTVCLSVTHGGDIESRVPDGHSSSIWYPFVHGMAAVEAAPPRHPGERETPMHNAHLRSFVRSFVLGIGSTTVQATNTRRVYVSYPCILVLYTRRTAQPTTPASDLLSLVPTA
jgi:hypothetical protein